MVLLPDARTVSFALPSSAIRLHVPTLLTRRWYPWEPPPPNWDTPSERPMRSAKPDCSSRTSTVALTSVQFGSPSTVTGGDVDPIGHAIGAVVICWRRHMPVRPPAHDA